MKQTALDGDGLFKSKSKRSIKANSMKFMEPSGKGFTDIINDLETVYKRTKFYSLFSGGKDSMYVATRLAEMGKLTAIVHIKTNIGLQTTLDFVKDYCQEQGWKLYVIEPNPKYTYADFVLEYGFPLPAMHRVIMGKLKYKTMRDFALSIDRKHHCLISGVRKFESTRRMGNYPYPIQTDASMWFGAPAFYMKNEEIYKYVMENNLRVSPAYKSGFHTSGECLCGAFAAHDDKRLIRSVDPKLADYIKWLEEGVRKFGTTKAQRYPTWGGDARMDAIEQEKTLDEFFAANPDLKPVNDMEELICGSECGPGTMRGMVDY